MEDINNLESHKSSLRQNIEAGSTMLSGLMASLVGADIWERNQDIPNKSFGAFCGLIGLAAIARGTQEVRALLRNQNPDNTNSQ